MNNHETLILALGNPLRGDDGVGVAVLDQLNQMDIPSHTILMDGGTPGLETVLLLKNYQRAVEIARENEDRDLELFEKNLETIKNKINTGKN